MKMCSSSSSVLTVSLCLLLCLLLCLSSDVTITAEPGQDVPLPCRAPSNTRIVVIEWTKLELDHATMFLYRDGRPDENLDPTIKGRMELKDSKMKDGDVSVILKKVTRDDTGTYECKVVYTKPGSSSRYTDPISIVHLQVHQSGDKEGGMKEENPGLGVGLALFFVAVGGGVGGGVTLYICRGRRMLRRLL